jgi:hypothetical protein
LRVKQVPEEKSDRIQWKELVIDIPQHQALVKGNRWS